MSDPVLPIVIVSGLPRSGTSLMMQMLNAGGCPVWTDAARTEDVSNPRGYFELEKVKSLAQDNSWLGEARGRAIKVIAQLVPFLAPDYPYRVIMMRRDIGEVVRSQEKMLAVEGKSLNFSSSMLASVFEKQLDVADSFVRRQSHMQLLDVNYGELLQDPARIAAAVVAALPEFNLDCAAMARAVDPTLYRTRL